MKVAKVKCDDCSKTFTRKSNMYAHRRNKHKIEPIVAKKSAACLPCNKSYANEKTLLQHMKYYHDFELSKKNKRIKCPHGTCDGEFGSFAMMRTHLSKKHGIRVEVEKLTFDHYSEFVSWKTEIERRTASQYVLDCGSRKTQHGIRRHYFCHRSWNSMVKARGVRTTESNGSNKMNRACPSKIEVTKTKGDGISKTFVTFWKTHYGHGQGTEIVRAAQETVTAGSIQADRKEWIVPSSQDHKLDPQAGDTCSSECPVHKTCMNICTCPYNTIGMNACEHIMQQAYADSLHESFDGSHNDDANAQSFSMDNINDDVNAQSFSMDNINDDANAPSSSMDNVDDDKSNLSQLIQNQASVGSKLEINENIIQKAELIHSLAVVSLVSDEVAPFLVMKMNEIIYALSEQIQIKSEEY